jgi:hypothetical protein
VPLCEHQVARDIEEEFFSDLEQECARLTELGFDLERERFSELSWGIAGTLKDPLTPPH